jgi:hypothetical protein
MEGVRNSSAAFLAGVKRNLELRMQSSECTQLNCFSLTLTQWPTSAVNCTEFGKEGKKNFLRDDNATCLKIKDTQQAVNWV